MQVWKRRSLGSRPVRVLLLAFAVSACGAPGATVAPPPLGAQTTAAAADPGLQRLEQEITRLARLAGGTVGVGAIHLETGREVYLNRGVRFPMASSYKVPIAVQLLTRVDRGELRMDSMIAIQPGDISPGSGTLSQLFQHPGVSLSVRNLTELMLLISDNSATDVVLRTAGGPAAVTARMRALGLQGIQVDRSTLRLISDFIGIRNLPPEEEVTPARFRELAGAVGQEEQQAAARAFNDDLRDTSTPEDMARLLARVWHKEILTRESSELLLDIMRRSTTGAERIKGMLPPWIEVSHKTGTIGGTTNDVGIIELPEGAGHVVTVLYVKESERDVPTRERAIAQISRAIYDYFLFNPGNARRGS